MKHIVKNIGGPTFVHTVDGLVTIEPGASITAEFDPNELAAIKANEQLDVTAAKDEAKATKTDAKKTGE